MDAADLTISTLCEESKPLPMLLGAVLITAEM
jgi:hypothetical protein